jgi:hypothetical protein
LAMKPEAPHRARLPRPPPIKIQSAFHINPTAPRLMALVGVISTETDQAVFPFGKANSIAAANMPQFRSRWQPESTGMHGRAHIRFCVTVVLSAPGQSSTRE